MANKPMNFLLVSLETKQRLDTYVKLAPGEISGLGIISIAPVYDFVINEVYLLKQESNTARTVLDQNAIGELLYEIVKTGQDPSLLKFWWHSHGQMDVFWSAEDEQTINTLGEGKDWWVSLEINKRGQYLARLDIFNPVRTIVPLEVEFLYPENKELLNSLTEEVKNKVKVLPQPQTFKLPKKKGTGKSNEPQLLAPVGPSQPGKTK